MNLSTVKNLIFDLGGVILDLSVDHTIDGLATLSGFGADEVLKRYTTEGGFELYEKGGMSDKTFREFVKEVYQVRVADDQVDAVWNAMLRGIPDHKLALLDRLRSSYNVFLLSNTNNIHLHHVNNVMMPATTHSNRSLDSFFDRAYYSHLVKMRKPDAEIFEHVLADSRLQAEETLFLDDNAANIKGQRRWAFKHSG
ncbi:MAG: HAD family phosphatase [Bacteroidia bacterium]|nr:HAD family phosphatase [Bacteroidia bacterium]